MENQPLNQTQMPQMPQGMNGMNQGAPHEEHKHTGRTIFVAILIIILAGFLGYWYFTAPNKVPTVEDMPQQATSTQTEPTNDELMANVSASEEELDGLYFEGVADGM